MADKVLIIFEKPIYLSFEPCDPHLFASAFGAIETPARVSILLREAAVTYAVKDQDPGDVRLMGLEVVEADTSPAKVLDFIMQNGAPVSVVKEDLEARGISQGDLLEQVRVIPEAQVADLVESHEGVMVW